MSSEVAGGALSGAASGAAAGTAILPGIGTAIGAVVGAVFGAFGGKKSKQAKQYARQAQDVENKMADVANAAARRQQIREAYITRAIAVAAGASEDGGLQSSTVQGAIGSIESQNAYNTRYFDTQMGLGALYNRYNSKAGKYASESSTIFKAIDAGSDLATAWGKRRAPAPTTTSLPKGPSTRGGPAKVKRG